MWLQEPHRGIKYTSAYQYILVHTSTYHTCTYHDIVQDSTYWYILVHTSTYFYVLGQVDCQLASRLASHLAAMTWYEGVHVAIHHIMESHDIV
jgi:hypothetical protein